MKDKCPVCRGIATEINDYMVCLECGQREYLYDYPNAWDINGGSSDIPEVPTNDTDSLISIKRALSNHTRVLKQQANAIKELSKVRPYKKNIRKDII